jgi:cellulose synthase/poly-beta-1,6-N-acetylglucosamine synthase-like glycosyltransferase
MKIFLNDQVILFINWLLLVISLVFFVFYCYFIFRLKKLWNSKSADDMQQPSGDDPFVSVIIAGRNEALNLRKCIDSILTNEYPKSLFEIIYIDDHSVDNSVIELSSIASENFRFYELKNHSSSENLNSYKKMAISYGISKAKGEIVLLTDADTIAGKNWIQSHTDIFKTGKEVKLCTGPVIFFGSKTFIEQFQYYDLIATMGFTNGGIARNSYFMANGANMSFLKEIYETDALKTEYASGDDMFFVQRTAGKFPGSVRFIKSVNAAVYTYPEKTLRSFFHQRLRWGSKSRGYSDMQLKLILSFIFLTNLLIIIDIVWFSLNISLQSLLPVMMIILKLIIDRSFIRSVALDLRQKIDFPVLTASLLLYPLYIVPMGILSLVSSNYTWKGRKVK